VAWFFLDQPLDAPALAGLALIVGGVVVINVFSKAAAE
jgi:small multidrug resistance pump